MITTVLYGNCIYERISTSLIFTLHDASVTLLQKWQVRYLSQILNSDYQFQYYLEV